MIQVEDEKMIFLDANAFYSYYGRSKLWITSEQIDEEDIKKYIEEYEINYPCWWRCQIIQYLGKPKKLFLMCVRMHFIPGIRFIAYLHSLMIKKGA